ncbi:MAG: glycine zipper domain-containing protein [Acetobacteraceae bacterium]
MKSLCVAAVALMALTGCSNLSPTENRLAGGTLAGATGGAVLGAIAGNAALGTVIGAGVGLAGGAIYNHIKNNE